MSPSTDHNAARMTGEDFGITPWASAPNEKERASVAPGPAQEKPLVVMSTLQDVATPATTK